MGSSRPPRGITRDQEIENRYDLIPYFASSSRSSFHSLYESVATSPFRPSNVFPGCLAKSSQIDFPRPPTAAEPSIWKLAGGNKKGLAFHNASGHWNGRHEGFHLLSSQLRRNLLTSGETPEKIFRQLCCQRGCH